MSTTVGDIIRSSMRKIGVLAAGEPLPASDSNDAIVTLRQMVDAWTTESLLIPIVSKIKLPLVSGTAEYKIGVVPLPKPSPIPEDTLDTARPEKILASYIRDGSGTDYPVREIAVTRYSGINSKSASSRPSSFYIRKDWPYNTLILNSMPYEDDTLHLEVIQPFAEMLPVVGLTEEIDLPPGYERGLIYNLCLELAPEWNGEVSNLVAIGAVNGKKLIKRNNSRSLVLTCDRALISSKRGTYNIRQGV